MKNSVFIKPFQYCNFRYLFYSEMFFYMPAWMAVMTLGLIVTNLKGNSPFNAGLISFSFNLPMLFGPFIGIIIDRYQRINILKGTSLIALTASICMAWLIDENWLNFGIMLLIAAIYGFCCAFYYPAILTGTTDVINDARVSGNGISIVNSTNRIMSFFGYGLGGLLVSCFGEQSIFWCNAISLLLSFLFLTRITTKVSLTKEKKSPLIELISGLSSVKAAPPVLAVIVLMSLIGLLSWPYLFQAPIVNRYYLHGTPGTLGFLLAVGGLGGTLGAIFMSTRASYLYLNATFLTATAVLAINMILLALCHSVFWAVPVFFLLDLCLMVTLTTGIIFIQFIVSKEHLGCVMGILSMVSFGTIPIGSVVFYGTIGKFFGVMHAFIFAGFILLLGIFWYIKKLPEIQKYALPIFIKKNLLKDKNDMHKI